MKQSFTTTSRFLNETVPMHWVHKRAPVWMTPFQGEPIPRLGAGLPSPKTPRTPAEIAFTLRTFPTEQAIFFPDTNFFSKAIDPLVWEALLSKRIAITPLVWEELQPWLTKPFYNQQVSDLVVDARAVRVSGLGSGDRLSMRPLSSHARDRIIFLDLDSDFRDYGYDYYMNLLEVRKLIGREILEELMTKHGSKYDDQMFVAECQKRYGERGLRVAKDALEKSESPTFSADEQLITMASLTAILAGHETFVLTWDTGVQEQYFKLQRLIINDYICNRAGQILASYPGAAPFRRVEVPPRGEIRVDKCRISKWENPIAGDSFQAAIADPGFYEHILPKHFRPVCTYCLLFGGHEKSLQVSEFCHCLECEITPLLQTKTNADGRNTDLHGILDCHIGSMEGGKMMVCLCENRITTCCGLRVSVFDKFAALNTEEQTSEYTFGRIIVPSF